MNKEKKEKTLVELTEEEFLKTLFDTTESLQRDIYDIKEVQSKFFKLYRNYTYDKNKYRLTFHVKDNILGYTKHDKSVGYKYGGKK